ncbi:MAG TPA: hypothetical protein ENH31_05420 [Nitrospirae bacterium]|nr:hypothetical protein BMS3Bbin08_00911 [bacterium BMS3Bbin08]HDK81994.1 hypothetical protein [Nitrospirota bacterium]
MEILKRVMIKSIIILLPAAGAAAFLKWEKMPEGIIAGGALGLLNLRGLVRSVEGLAGAEKAALRMVILSMIRLTVLLAVIFPLIWLRIVNVIGMLIGFTIVFMLILFEGARVGRSS